MNEYKFTNTKHGELELPLCTGSKQRKKQADTKKERGLLPSLLFGTITWGKTVPAQNQVLGSPGADPINKWDWDQPLPLGLNNFKWISRWFNSSSSLRIEETCSPSENLFFSCSIVKIFPTKLPNQESKLLGAQLFHRTLIETVLLDFLPADSHRPGLNRLHFYPLSKDFVLAPLNEFYRID